MSVKGAFAVLAGFGKCAMCEVASGLSQACARRRGDESCQRFDPEFYHSQLH